MWQTMAAWLGLLLWAQVANPQRAIYIHSPGGSEEPAAGCSQLLESVQDDAAVLVREGACHYQLGDYPRATELFRKAIGVVASLPVAWKGLGLSLVAQGKYEEAIPWLEKATKMIPTDRNVRRALGYAYGKQHDFFRGEGLLRSLVTSDPKDGLSWFYLGELLYGHNYYQPALQALETALKLQPDNLQALVYLAGALAQVGLVKKAEAAFARLLDMPQAAQSAEVRLNYAQFLFRTQQQELALNHVDYALQLRPESAVLRFWRARILFHLGRAEEAAVEAEHAVRLVPELPNPRILLMKICNTLGRTEEAARQATWLSKHESERKGLRQ